MSAPQDAMAASRIPASAIRRKIADLVAKDLMASTWHLRPLMEAMRRVRGGTCTEEAARRVSDIAYDDGEFFESTFESLVAAQLIGVPRGTRMRFESMLKFWQVEAYEKAQVDALKKIIDASLVAASPTRSDFSVTFVESGCEVRTTMGHLVVSCRKGLGIMTVHDMAANASEPMRLVIGSSYPNGRELLQAVVDAFLCIPGSFEKFLRFPVARSAFRLDRKRTYLCVPSQEAKEAQTAGAEWDAEENAWHAPGLGDGSRLSRWMPTFDIRPDPLPETCWFSNVRSHVSEADWSRIKKMTFAAAGMRCRSCGGRGKRWPVECHEVWEFDDRLLSQTLKGMTALCPSCHEVVHYGLANMRGRASAALDHMRDVRGQGSDVCLKEINAAIGRARKRSAFRWSLNLAFLDGLNIAYERRT